MSDFSDRPLVAGSLIGLRAFNIDKYGRLVGPSQKTVFKPAENAAECHSTKNLLSGLPSDSDVSLKSDTWLYGGTGIHASYHVTLPSGESRTFPSAEAIATAYPPAPITHDIGSLGCGCGFYAYFDGKNDYHTSGNGSVEAVIEGYGTCTVGDRGFRASRAELRALVTPKELRPKVAEEAPSRARWFVRALESRRTAIALAAVNALAAVTSVAMGHYVSAVVSLVWAVTITAQSFLGHRERREAATSRRRPSVYAPLDITPKVTAEQWESVRRAYPDVPVYDTRSAALAAHPLTVPATPSPEDPEFWTRSA